MLSRVWATALGLVALGLVALGCGDDSAPLDAGGDAGVDASASDGAVPDGGDAGEVDAGPPTPELRLRLQTPSADPIAGPAVVSGARVWLRDAAGELRVATSDEAGLARFALTAADWPIELTMVAEGFVPVSFVGFEEEDLGYFAERGLVQEEAPGEAPFRELQLLLERLPRVWLSGAQVGAEGDVLVVESTAGGEPFSGAPGPWSLRVQPRESARVVGWVWSEREVAEPRSLAWDVDVASLELSTERDASELELDFRGEPEAVTRSFGFRVPADAPFHDAATPVGALLLGNESDGPGMTIGFPTRTRWDAETRTVSVETWGPSGAGFASTGAWMAAQLVGEAGSSTVVQRLLGEGEVFDAAFLVPPALDEATADGIAWGEPVRWEPDGVERIESVVYLGGPAPWIVQAWGAAQGAAAPPALPEALVDELLGEAPLQALVSTCDLVRWGLGSGGCERQTQSAPFPVSR
ncbi:MAG TPA: hypothetical protein RMH85_33695 [Polyangiaceae bacterium LLY-WYZ-15_(1-7)]|nr:hypothetical protein [Polyangiaceae bacterium LLY-WYZ-15_(1-7)]HJL05988.1 hypothetical protein [Polyangiaceae bacterium LLY-WYZ-15_(1-7)]HJL13486.1 hypothetical protein [Polyangiaceae bacterium LLY-WYZ-15_(1-7)]HJL25932.1 hypothetical protein [Polyangiaceae bacterium LLY-WYZ-15_(1-7)]HJL31977.1 hypothetical protein [Polyangiaceae bacterium LLY-WYZ-15_(1-7)]